MEVTHDWVNVENASRVVGLDRSTLYRLAREGRVRSFRILGRVLFERTDLLALIEEIPARVNISGDNGRPS